jgi:CheY-like chemotaxis protein
MASNGRENGLPSHVVHELKTALSMIVGFAELLEMRADTHTRVEAAHGIFEAAGRLRTAIEVITGVSLDDPPLDDMDYALSPSSDHNRHRLLVIDDDPSELEILRAAFPSESFDILEVRDADEAFDLLEDAHPDLVILDWKLPGGGGPETLAELKMRNPDLPVIVLSDDGDPKQRQIATLLDAEEFVPRPFDPLELLGKAEGLAQPA